MPTIDKLAALQAMLAEQPSDPFLLYGIAMEHKKRNDTAQAIEYFDRCIAADPKYCYAYYQRGQVQELAGDTEGAKSTYRRGIDAAAKSGDAHAREELTAALSQIS
jgi:tetratricopeptide (TPR) repeat protein